MENSIFYRALRIVFQLQSPKVPESEMVMDALSFVCSAAQTVFAALQCSQLKALFSEFGVDESKLHNLVNTFKTIEAVMLDADSNEGLSSLQLLYIDNLKDVAYDIDDLIDELTTIDLQQHPQSPEKVLKPWYLESLNKTLVKKLKKKIDYIFEKSQEVTNIKNKLDQTESDANKFSNKIVNQPIIRKGREETCSHVIVNDIVGRDDDLKKMVDVLLDSNTSQEDVCVVTIVGIGGLGKTTLAQLIYNDPRIEEEFPLRLWACVSDQDQEELEVKPILANILFSESTFLGKLVSQLKEKLNGKKYLLVLDDVWTENHSAWSNLKQYFLGLGQKGNKIVVTTRSKGTAIAVGSRHTYELKGLSEEYSWSLFEKTVGSERANCPNLVQTGNVIVNKCANVPLAIKEIGNILYCTQDEKKWRNFGNLKLMDIKKDENHIMETLEFSYRYLSPSLKSCFTYCALFPKDFVFEKEKLLGLWMAHNYVKLKDGIQRIEDIAEDYFQILSSRCFFQGPEEKFKMHDLMHDMAQQIAGKEFSTAISTTSSFDEKIRHVYDDAPDSHTNGFMVSTKIRTYVQDKGGINFPVDLLLENWKNLRALDLCDLGLTNVPDAIDKLLHLRYLDLSGNKNLETLPESLTTLINLQYLNLKGCDNLKELPNDFNKLVNLRTLHISQTP